MKSLRWMARVVCLPVLAGLLAGGCATAGRAGDGIILIGDRGKSRPVTPEEVDALSGVDRPYFLQVGDVVNLDFAVRAVQGDEPAWDYRVEVGDSMEVRLSPPKIEPGEYRLETGDVIGISFLDNWQLNVTRTVRPDGMITAPDVGDVQAAGRTAIQLRERLRHAYAASGIIEGDPRITVNVDFVNADRYEDMSRDVIVRPDGAISLPGLRRDVRIAGLTVDEACRAIADEAERVMENRPLATLVLFPAVDTSVLEDMGGAMQVRPDGMISVPRIGEVQAAGFSVAELRQALAQLCEGVTHNPLDITVDVLKTTGGRIYVGGEVSQPGVYPLEGAPTALQAVMMANGFLDTSRLNNVIVLRRNPEGKPYVFNTNLRVALTRGLTENDIRLMPFDTVYVPKKNISKANLVVDQYINQIVPFDNTLGINAQYYLNTQRIDTRGRSINFSTGVTGIADVLNP